MPRPIQAQIHPDALSHNLSRARASAPDAKVWAVVKADAYGHGIERAFPGLQGADGFALLDLAEAEVFHRATHDLPGDRSLCNSAATLRFAPSDAEARADWIRPGIMSYGSAPDFPARSAADWDLQPGMTLRSQLIATQDLQPGDTVGYGSSFRAEAPMRIGVVACGYADGYPRVAPTGTPILVDGVRTRTLGRVSMDMLAVDLGPVPAARIGSEVTLWGRGPAGSLLSIDEVAHAAGTLGYELMCALAPRVPVLTR